MSQFSYKTTPGYITICFRIILYYTRSHFAIVFLPQASGEDGATIFRYKHTELLRVIISIVAIFGSFVSFYRDRRRHYGYTVAIRLFNVRYTHVCQSLIVNASLDGFCPVK
jgi:hypothetical protein